LALARDIPNFEAFWPVYLREHRCVRCRLVHYLAALTVVALITTSACAECWWLLCAAPLAAYGLAWFGHFVFEKNRPATWVYPLWSLRAEWRMCGLALTGRLKPHLDRHLRGEGDG
jgi:hypothetical protein